jgi:hypothetical protein
LCELARIRRREILDEAAWLHLVPAAATRPHPSIRRRVASAIVAFGNVCLLVGEAVGGAEVAAR